jgi:hypothetical protein
MATHLFISNKESEVYTTDVIISINYPGVEYDATESGALHFEDREVDGAMYRVTNATFDRDAITGPQWARVASGQDSYAIVQNSDGSLGFLKAPASDTWGPEGWLGNGQRGVFNVYDFGAAGNGTTPDAAAIQAAADAIGEAGGVLYFPRGTFFIDTAITLSNGTTVLGDGPTVSVLKADTDMNGFMTGDSTLDITMLANATYSSDTPSGANLSVRNMGFNGNGSQNTGDGSTTTITYGLISFVGVVNQSISGCALYDSAHDGVYISGASSTEAQQANFRVIDCQIDLIETYTPPSNVSGAAIRCLNSDEGIINRNSIGFNFTSQEQHSDGIDCRGCSNLTVQGNQITLSSSGINVDDGSDVIITSNIVTNVATSGISTSVGGDIQGVARLLIAANVIQIATSGILVEIGSGSTITPSTLVSGNSIALVPGLTAGGIGISIAAKTAVCDNNMVDLAGNVTAIGIICSVDAVTIDSNYVFSSTVASGLTGIELTAAATDSLAITSNNVNSLTTPIEIPSVTGLTHSVIRDNDGYNPYGSIPAPMMHSGTSVQNAFPFDCMVYIYGGGGVDVSIDGTDTGLGTGGYLVPIGGRISATWSSMPTFVWIAN